MKIVSGRVESTNPISLSKAAKVLYNFVAAETGASQAVSTYLSRASTSFNDLALFHKVLIKSSKPDLKFKLKNVQKGTNYDDPVKLEQNPEESEVGLGFEDSVGSYGVRKRHKKRMTEREDGGSLVIGDGESGSKKNKKKRRR